MKKLVSIAASLLIAGAPISVLAERNPWPWPPKWSPDPHHHSDEPYEPKKDDDDSSKGTVDNPCAVSNPVLGGKGCLFIVNGQIVTSNGDGTFTTSAGNVFDGNGKLLYNIYSGSGAAAAGAGSRSGVPNTGESDNTAYYVMMGGALIVMAGAGYVLATNK